MSESEDLLFGLETIYISCSVNHMFVSFAYFSTGLPVIFLFICRSSLYIEISPLSTVNFFPQLLFVF